jgi:hypothetical protein
MVGLLFQTLLILRTDFVFSSDPVPALFVPFPPVAFIYIDTTFEEKSRELAAD